MYTICNQRPHKPTARFAIQVEVEVLGCLDFIAYIYRLFGFNFRVKLSTRPDKFVGEVAVWDIAEAALRASLARFTAGSSGEFEVDVGGGAFYGPKIDVFVRDAVGREHQCATVQLDFQLPVRFDLEFVPIGGTAGPATTSRPVIIHRAILGSLERMMGILCEHTGGRWPFWLSPRQIIVCSVAERHALYASKVAELLSVPKTQATPDSVTLNADASRTGFHDDREDSGLWVDVDVSDRTVPRKVRDGQAAQYNLILVVGDAEEQAGSVTVRFRDELSWTAFERAAAAVDPTVLAISNSLDAPRGAAADLPSEPGKTSRGGATDASGVTGSKAKKTNRSGGGESEGTRRMLTLSIAVLRRICAEMVARKV